MREIQEREKRKLGWSTKRERERQVGDGGGWELTSQNKIGEAKKTMYLIKLIASFKVYSKLQLAYSIILDI